MSDEPAYELIYGEAVRAVDRQQAAVSELRGRAALLIATASIAISLLGESPFGGVGAGFAWLAFAAFVTVCASALAVTWPRAAIADSTDIGSLVRTLTGNGPEAAVPPPAGTYLTLIIGLAYRQRLNAELIASLSLTFRLGSTALASQLVATVATRIITS